jgi:hypothetical protein|tara:strand:+ start:326 stop:718 length:393 start_codon:yes stop_codon:yes gene_type:complete
MIILTYISGLLTAVLVVLIIASVRVHKKYTLLLESNQHTLNISSIRVAESSERMQDIEDILTHIRSDYVPNGDLAKQILSIRNDTNHLSNAINENRKFSENSKKQLLNENLTLRKNLDGLREDPNFTSRY